MTWWSDRQERKRVKREQDEAFKSSLNELMEGPLPEKPRRRFSHEASMMKALGIDPSIASQDSLKIEWLGHGNMHKVTYTGIKIVTAEDLSKAFDETTRDGERYDYQWPDVED